MKSFSTLLILALAPALLFAPPSFAKKKSTDVDARIRHLLEVTGAKELGMGAISGTLEPMKAALPQVPDEFWEGFMAEVSPDDLINLIVPIYKKHLSLKEIEAMIKFYESKEGKHVVEVLPAIQAEAMQVGQAWGAELANRVITKLQQEMPELMEAPAEAPDAEVTEPVEAPQPPEEQ